MSLASRSEVVSWVEPASPPRRGTVVVLPGRGESPEVYERFGRRLTLDAYRVHAVAAPTDDAELTIAQIRERLDEADQDLPRILVGSDGGAAFALHLAAAGRIDGVHALVLAGLPSTESPLTPRSDWGGELDARTSCPTHRARISDAGIRPGELFTALPSQWFSHTDVSRLALPILGLHGTADVISPIESARKQYARFAKAELVALGGASHDVLNDQSHRTAAATVVIFLERLRLSADAAPIAVPVRLDAA